MEQVSHRHHLRSSFPRTSLWLLRLETWTTHIYIYTYIYTCKCTYIYIYIYLFSVMKENHMIWFLLCGWNHPGPDGSEPCSVTPTKTPSPLIAASMAPWTSPTTTEALGGTRYDQVSSVDAMKTSPCRCYVCHAVRWFLLGPERREAGSTAKDSLSRYLLIWWSDLGMDKSLFYIFIP